MPNEPETKPSPADDPLREALADATRPTAIAGQYQPPSDETAPMGVGEHPTRRNLSDSGDPVIAPRPPTETVHLHRGEIWGGDFELGPLVGRGGMGAVYSGRQISLDRPVAIKALRGHLSDDPELVARFAQEAKWLARISSPHVIQVHAFGRHRNHHFLVMELIEGEDLGRKLKTGWRPSPAEVVALIAQAAKGLIAAGEHGIVHRDIKPGNMLLDARGTLKLTDFGLARLVHGSSNLSSTGVILGTDAYMSPEQCQGRGVDQRSDIYSLGVVFYELLTGRRPFVGETHMEVFVQHLDKAPRPPRELEPEIPAAVESVVLTCLEKDPAKRYASAAELLADLERVAAREAPLRQPERRARWRRVAATLLVLAACGAIWWWWPRTPPATVVEQHAPPPPPPPPAKQPDSTPARMTSAIGLDPPKNAPPAPPPPTPGSDAPQVEEHQALVRRGRERLRGIAALSGPRASEVVSPLQLRDRWNEAITEFATVPELRPQIDEALLDLAWCTQPREPSWSVRNELKPFGPKATLEIEGYQQVFHWCPSGHYRAGSDDQDPLHRDDETAHEVVISSGFWIADTEVTARQWNELMGSLKKLDADAKVPATFVSWDDANAFCAALSAKLGGVKVSLPTEAQWEYACRAGQDLAPKTIAGMAYFGSEHDTPQAVQQFEPNGWGLYDMYGNVAEWCADAYAPYPTEAVRDPFVEGAPDDKRVVRGGCVGFPIEQCRAASRDKRLRSERLPFVGFRVIVAE